MGGDENTNTTTETKLIDARDWKLIEAYQFCYYLSFDMDS